MSDEEELLKCYYCKKSYCLEDSNLSCYKCFNILCDECYENEEEWFERYEPCRELNCFYCRNLTCFNNRHSMLCPDCQKPGDISINETCGVCFDECCFTSCDNCDIKVCLSCVVPFADDDEDQITYYCKEECVPDVLKEFKAEKERQKNIRTITLKNHLKKAGLELRSDSKLCQKYIDGECNEKENIEYIVERMSQMKFLFEYNNFRDKIRKVREEYYNHFNDYDGTFFEEAERRFLKKKSYPEVYPWQKDKHARTIQRNLENWLWKPICADGTIGINLRIQLRKSKEDGLVL